MLHILGLLVSLAAVAIADNSYKVFRVFPRNLHQLRIVQALEYDSENFSFWKSASAAVMEAHIMVAPSKRNFFIQLMDDKNISYNVLIDDVEAMISTTANNRTHLFSNEFNWMSYHNLDEIYNWMHSIAQRYSVFIKEIEIGHSFEQCPIKGLKLSYGDNSKPAIFIEGGIHPQEWISPATATYLLNKLLTSTNQSIINLAKQYDWYFFPVVNPDGYAYTHENPTNLINRLWRKTRSAISGNNEISVCYGADLDSNWSYQWDNFGHKAILCNENYAGSSPFSESESRALSLFITRISEKLFAYISLRSYGETLSFPATYRDDSPFGNHNQLEICKEAVNVLKEQHGTEYTYDRLDNIRASVFGSSLLWARRVNRLPLVYAYEMRDKGNYGFLLPPSQIIPNGEEVMQSLIALLAKAKTYGEFKTMHYSR